MKKSLLLIIFLFTTFVAFAQIVATIDGIKYYLYRGEAAVMVQDKSLSGDIVIPEIVYYNGVSFIVTSVEDEAFRSQDINRIVFPKTITSIGNNCFNGCLWLKEITFPEYLKSLGDFCFYWCISLKSISLPNGIITLGKYCFSECSGLESVNLPNGITTLGNSCFSNCNGLTSITLPNSITSLGNLCFAGCSSLTSIILPNSLKSLGSSCFSGCSSLTSVTLPNSITSLGSSCFSNCKGLTSITLPNSITSLGDYCFNACTGLTSITLPNSITSLGEGCFDGCSSLASITLPYGITSLGRMAFYNCTSLKSVNLPNSITSLGVYCFFGCSSLNSIILPNNITSLDYGCFSHCTSLKSITLPKSITFIEECCFLNCISLEEVFCGWESLTKVNAEENAFNNIRPEACLYVPKGTTDIYRAKEPWSSFKYIEEVSGEQCATPNISYSDRKLIFTSETEGAEYHYTITAPDAKANAYSENGTVEIAAAYKISVYASADGYTNSDVATATLYFISAGLETGVNAVAAAERGVLVSQDGQSVTVSGLDDGETVTLYTASGMMLSTARAVAAGTVTLDTRNERGVMILKVGNESLKISL